MLSCAAQKSVREPIPVYTEPPVRTLEVNSGHVDNDVDAR